MKYGGISSQTNVPLISKGLTKNLRYGFYGTAHNLSSGFVARVTRRVPLVEQELPTLATCYSFYSFLCVDLYIAVCPFVFFHFPLYCLSFSVFTDSDHPLCYLPSLLKRCWKCPKN
jgi:hypothetical protein